MEHLSNYHEDHPNQHEKSQNRVATKNEKQKFPDFSWTNQQNSEIILKLHSGNFV